MTELDDDVSDTWAHAYIDAAFFLPSLEPEGGGNLLLKGWAFGCKTLNGTTACFGLEISPRSNGISLGQAICSENRADVVSAFPGAPLTCGFELIVPVPNSRGLNEMTIAYMRGDVVVRADILTPQVIDQATDLAPDGVLAPWKVAKLENYLLNERERLASACTLQSNPVHLYIDPNFSCQLNCTHCVSDMLREAGYNIKTLKTDILDNLLARYGETLISVSLTGWGEPLLNLQFADLVRRLKAHHVWVETSTNLSLPLSDQRIQELVSSGLDSVRLSIDGATQDIYARYRVNGDLALVLDNVRRIVECRQRSGSTTPVLKWQYLVFPWNAHEIGEAEALSRNLGVDMFYTMPGEVHPRKAKSPLSRPVNEKPRPPDESERLDWIALRDTRQRNFGYFGCDALYRSMLVHSNGLTMPCCYVVEPKDAIGWADDPDLFNSPILKANRRLIATIDDPKVVGYDPCLHCPMMSQGYYSPAGHVAGPVGFFDAYRYLVKDEFLY